MLRSRSCLFLAMPLSGTALGATLPLRSLLTASPSTGEGRDLLLGVGQQSTTVPGQVNRGYVVAQRECRTPNERNLFNTAVTDVALKCVTLRPERKAATAAWMNVQNASVFRDVSPNFGPMTLRFSRALNDDGEYWTSVSLTRSGVPGVSPWGNDCTP